MTSGRLRARDRRVRRTEGGLGRAPRRAGDMPTAEAVKAEETLIHVLWINAGSAATGTPSR